MPFYSAPTTIYRRALARTGAPKVPNFGFWGLYMKCLIDLLLRKRQFVGKNLTRRTGQPSHTRSHGGAYEPCLLEHLSSGITRNIWIFCLGIKCPSSNLQVNTASQQNVPPQQEQLQMFEGTVVSVNGLFFLQAGGKGALYGLDNQVVAKSFANEKVVVTGVLDARGTIHIKDMEEQKA